LLSFRALKTLGVLTLLDRLSSERGSWENTESLEAERPLESLIHVWFLISVLGVVAVVSLHFSSVEHLKFQKKNGKEKGTRIGEILGLASGWGFFGEVLSQTRM